MNKPSRSYAKPLRDLIGKVVGDAFTRQGFASAELVTRWSEIVGADIAAHSEPMKITWTRPVVSAHRSAAGAPGSGRGAAPTGGTDTGWGQQPGVLVLRVEGPAAVEIQHCGEVICERVNRFFGWRAVERISLRQAPLRRGEGKPARGPDADETARVAATLDGIADDDLKAALARLGASVKRG